MRQYFIDFHVYRIQNQAVLAIKMGFEGQGCVSIDGGRIKMDIQRQIGMDQIPDLFGTGLKRRNIEGIVIVLCGCFDVFFALIFIVNAMTHTGLQQKNTRDN